MYGLVNRAIADLIRERFGEQTWSTVRRKAGVDIDGFVSMEGYPDEVTYKLVGAAAEVLNTPAEALLEAFGEYWILYTAQAGYGELLRMGGSSFPEFMLNLHNLHTHVALTFAHLTPPSFWCTDVGENSLRLHYQSARPGLGPMVVGLVKGLGKRFDTAVEITSARSRADGADHDEFEVRFRPPA